MGSEEEERRGWVLTSHRVVLGELCGGGSGDRKPASVVQNNGNPTSLSNSRPVVTLLNMSDPNIEPSLVFGLATHCHAFD